MEQVFIWYIPFILGFAICMVLMMTGTCVLLYANRCMVLKTCCKGCLKCDSDDGVKNCCVFVKLLLQLIILIPLILDIILFIVRISGNQSGPVWVIFAIGPPTIGCLIPCSMICYMQCKQNTQDPQSHSLIDPQSYHTAFTSLSEEDWQTEKGWQFFPRRLFWKATISSQREPLQYSVIKSAKRIHA